MGAWLGRNGKLIVIFLTGLLCRLIVSVMFFGSHDVTVQIHHAYMIRVGLPAWTSKLPVAYYVPPAMAIVAEKTNIPKHVAQELPAIAGDLLAAFLLVGIASRRGRERERWLWPAIYLLNPVTIILSAYHGNIDPVMAAMMLWSLDLRWRDKPIASGLAIGLAIAMKPTALLALPVLLIPPRRKGNIALGATGILFPIAICVPFAMTDPTFGRFLLTYSGMYGNWGVSMLFRQSENVAKQLFDAPEIVRNILYALNEALQSVGKYLLALILVDWLIHLTRRWRIDSFEKNAAAMAATYLVFYVFATGFGPQYLCFAVPFLLIASTRLSLIHCALLTPYLIVVYMHAALYSNPDAESPITTRLQSLTDEHLSLLVAHGTFALLAWLACIWVLWKLVRVEESAQAA
ncbi:MAG TPA: glycosyltransferase 87 family protein [Thermoanaerobaculia bacterium]